MTTMAFWLWMFSKKYLALCHLVETFTPIAVPALYPIVVDIGDFQGVLLWSHVLGAWQSSLICFGKGGSI